jgi:hypothetical protein
MKAEDACESIVRRYLSDNLNGFKIYKGFDGSELARNRIHIVCDRATPEQMADTPTGNWFCHMRFAVVTNYEDKTRTQRENAAGELFDMFLDQESLATLMNNLTDVPDFYVYGGKQGEGDSFAPEEISSATMGHEYIKTLSGVLYCRPSA